MILLFHLCAAFLPLHRTDNEQQKGHEGRERASYSHDTLVLLVWEEKAEKGEQGREC